LGKICLFFLVWVLLLETSGSNRLMQVATTKNPGSTESRPMTTNMQMKTTSKDTSGGSEGGNDGGSDGGMEGGDGGTGSDNKSTASSDTDDTDDTDDSGESSSDESYTDNTCEKESEPGGCSLLLEVGVSTEYALTEKVDVFRVVKESWRSLSTGGYDVSAISLYVEFLKFISSRRNSNDDRNRRLVEENADLEEFSTTEADIVTTVDDNYDYYYNFSVAFFDDSCTNIGLWFDFFSAVGDNFVADYNDYLQESSLNFTELGLGDTSIESITLYERSSTGAIIGKTTFNTENAGNNYNIKNIILIVNSLIIVCVSLL